MKTVVFTEASEYVAPQIEVMEVIVEKGFAVSFEDDEEIIP